MKVRSDEQLLLALNAPERPERGAEGDKRWHELQTAWVASWHGRPLPEGATAAQCTAWWKQAKKQHRELVQAAHQRFGTDDGGGGGHAPIAGLKLTKSWVEQHAPEIRKLSCESADTPGGGRIRHLQATVQGPDGDEDHDESIHFSPPAVLGARKQADRERRREERAVLALADRPKRRRLEEYWIYEQETAAALAKEQADMSCRLQRLSARALQPFTMRSESGGHVLWVPASRLEGLVGSFAEPRIDDYGFYVSLEPTAAEHHLSRGCFLCLCVLDCECCRTALSPRSPPPCPSSQCSAANEQWDDQWLGRVPWCSHRGDVRNRRGHQQQMPWAEMQRRWLASDGSSGARDALLAEWCALDFCVARRRAASEPTWADTQWTLYRGADERAAAAAAAEDAEVADWDAMLDDVLRASDSSADVHSDACTRWQQQIASERYSQRHCFLCFRGQDSWADGCFKRRQTAYASGPVLQWCPAKDSNAPPPPCSKADDQQHSWTWTVPRAQQNAELRLLPAELMASLIQLKAKAELSEDWSRAFVVRWGEVRAEAAACAREKACRAQANVRRVSRVLDAMRTVARDAGKLAEWGFTAAGENPVLPSRPPMDRDGRWIDAVDRFK